MGMTIHIIVIVINKIIFNWSFNIFCDYSLKFQQLFVDQ
jgi:hypothetical protein